MRARHFDVPSAYLKAYTEDEIDIYLQVPVGMNVSKEELARVEMRKTTVKRV